MSKPNPRVNARNVSRGVVRGTQEFGRGFWKSFGRAAHALWHEITGVFFAIFAAFFAQQAWNMRSNWLAGSDHDHFWIYVVVAAVFLYFSISAFIRSRRPARKP